MKSAEIDFKNPKWINALAYAAILTALTGVFLPPTLKILEKYISKGIRWGLIESDTIFLWMGGLFALGVCLMVGRYVPLSWPNRSKFEWIVVVTQLAGLNLMVLPQYGLDKAFILGGAGILLSGLLLGLSPKKPVPREKVEDELYRGYFAKRIGENLRSPNPNMRRIAVLAPWGEGKTRLLKLIRQDLENNDGSKGLRFKCAWVNPWKTSSPEDARRAIAHAINAALGERSLLPFGWQRMRYIKSLIRKLRKETAGALFLDAVEAHFPDNAKEYLGKIDARIDSERERVVVFVDDMERSDPAVVRSMLPIIDSLSDLENIFFIFAIDPDRLANAFSVSKQGLESDKIEAEVSGYLGKVMDLQLGLENPTPTEISAWMKGKVEEAEGVCPKLYASFREIMRRLPDNPRCCSRFFMLAIETEKLFLSNYNDNEYDYVSLFLSLRLEAQFRGFMKFMRNNMELLNKVRVGNFMGKLEEGKRDKDELINKLKDKFGDEVLEESIKTTIIELCSRNDFFSDNNGNAADEWIFGGFRARRHLSSDEFDLVIDRWNTLDIPEPFSRVICDQVGYENVAPSHMQECVVQTLERIFSKLESFLRDVENKYVRKMDAVEVLLKSLSRHFSSSTCLKNEYDLFLVTDKDAIEVWVAGMIRAVAALPLEDDSKFIQIREARIKAFSSLLHSVPYSCSFIPRHGIHQDHRCFGGRASFPDIEIKKIFDSEINEIENDYLCFVIREVFSLLRHTDWKDCERTFSVPSQKLIAFEHPHFWVPKMEDGSFDISILRQISEEGDITPRLVQNAREMLDWLFMSPYIKLYSGSYGNAEFIDQDSDIVGYVREWWRIACYPANVETTMEHLLDLKEEMITSPRGGEGQQLNAEQIETMFPTPEGLS